jgi:coniferyl-aldehyde dehydrogenase
MNTTQVDQPAVKSGTFHIGRDIPVHRLGFMATTNTAPAAGSNSADMTPERMRSLLDRQRTAFLQEGAPAYETRIDRTDRLIALLVDNQDEIVSALNADYGHRSAEATLLTEVWSVIDNYKYTKLHLREWMQTEIHEAMFSDAEARVEYVPKGVVGVVSSWNFPWRLAFAPIGYVFAAGDRCMLKPSELTPATSALMAELAAQYFDETELAVVPGGPEIGAAFTALPFDHLIFTGSGKVGSAVMRAASETLTPVTLELGGKSPALIGKSADIGDAARRILTAKTFNAGQICLAPDYVLLPNELERQFVAEAKSAVAAMYPKLQGNPDYTSIINERHFNRLKNWIADAEAKGAEVIELNPASEDLSDVASHRIAPTLLRKVTDAMTVLQEEIFGPVLPIVTYETIEEAIAFINKHTHPLALYYFSNDVEEERKVLDRTTSGGVTVNDCMTHAFDNSLPFGGIGPSGMGAYHGRQGFVTFSHARPIYRQSKSPQAELLFRPPFGEPIQAFLSSGITK